MSFTKIRSLIVLTTGFLFVSISALLFVPLCVLLLPSRRLRIGLCNVFGKLVGGFCLWLAGTEIPSEASRRATQLHPAIYVSNHTSVFDVFFAIWTCPYFTCGVAKKEIAYVPFFGLLYLVSGHLLIDRGVLRGLLHDRLSARAAGVRPNGAGRRQSFRDVPLPRMSNTWLAAGEDDPADILRSVKLGVYAARFSGGQVNIASGDFTFALTEGYLIEDGRITAPLRGVHLIGNGPAALAAVSMVGPDLQMSEATWTCTKESQNVPVGVGMPTVKIDGLTIGGTEARR